MTRLNEFTEKTVALPVFERAAVNERVRNVLPYDAQRTAVMELNLKLTRWALIVQFANEDGKASVKQLFHPDIA